MINCSVSSDMQSVIESSCHCRFGGEALMKYLTPGNRVTSESVEFSDELMSDCDSCCMLFLMTRTVCHCLYYTNLQEGINTKQQSNVFKCSLLIERKGISSIISVSCTYCKRFDFLLLFFAFFAAKIFDLSSLLICSLLVNT